MIERNILVMTQGCDREVVAGRTVDLKSFKHSVSSTYEHRFGNSLHGITSEKWSIAHTLITVAALVALLNSGNYQSDNG